LLLTWFIYLIVIVYASNGKSDLQEPSRLIDGVNKVTNCIAELYRIDVMDTQAVASDASQVVVISYVTFAIYTIHSALTIVDIFKRGDRV